MSGVNCDVSDETLQYCKEFLEKYPEATNWDKSFVEKLMVSRVVNKNKRKGEKLSDAERKKRYRATKKAEKQQQHQATSNAQANTQLQHHHQQCVNRPEIEAADDNEPLMVSCVFNKNSYSSVARHIEPCICHIALRHIHGTT